MSNLLKNAYIYIGSYTQERIQADRYVSSSIGISVYSVDINGKWELIQVVPQLNPMYLVFGKNQEYIYAASSDSNNVYAYKVKENGKLEILNIISVNGKSTLCISANKTFTYLTVGSMSGMVETVKLRVDGGMESVKDSKQLSKVAGAIPKEQPWSRPHHTPFDLEGNYFFILDKGHDAVITCILKSSTGIIEEVRTLKLREGSMPRHIAFHPILDFAYIVTENIGTIINCHYDRDNGKLVPFQIIPTIPESFTENFNLASEIHVHPSGHYLFASNRGHDSLVSYKIEETGQLNQPKWNSSGGEIPRYFTLDSYGRYLLVANQKTGNIRQFQFDTETAKLNLLEFDIKTATPVYILIKNK